MATILLNDEEYNHLKAQLDEMTNKIETASPRAASHYARIAQMHADFLAKEEGKRALKQAKSAPRAAIDQKRMARRQATLQRQQAATQSAPTANTQSTQGSARKP